MTRIQRTLVSLILHSQSGVLLLERGQPYSEFRRQDPDTRVGVGLWELPGGALDFGETPLEAGVRESSEEIGVSIDQESLTLAACCAYVLKGSDCESHRIHIIYRANLGAPLQVRHSKEHVASRWVRDQGAFQGLSMIAEIRNLIAAAL
jgi:8-oxo-dGTP pyrophosphatase MutT (NUDIX family)